MLWYCGMMTKKSTMTPGVEKEKDRKGENCEEKEKNEEKFHFSLLLGAHTPSRRYLQCTIMQYQLKTQ